MSDNYVSNVLGILRLIKTGGGGERTPIHLITSWSSAKLNDPQVLRIAAHVIEQATGADAIIKGSSLSQEAKDGAIQATSGLARAFQVDRINTAIGSSLPALDASISILAILTSATGLDATPPPADVLSKLIEDIEAISAKLSDEALDPLVRDTAKRHVAALLTLLRNIEAFGVDAAMAAYTELVLRLRRATAVGTPETKEKVGGLWPSIEKWAGRIAIIDEAVNAGHKLLGHVDVVAQTLGGAAKLLGKN